MLSLTCPWKVLNKDVETMNHSVAVDINDKAAVFHFRCIVNLFHDHFKDALDTQSFYKDLPN